jgi:hypothetical protein
MVMATVEGNIEQALFARLAAFVHVPALSIAWPNVAMNPKPATYLRASHIPNTSRRLFLRSTEPHQRIGLMQVDVFTPLNQGAPAATEIAGKVAAHFQPDMPMRSGGVTTRVAKAPDVGPALADDTHWQVPVTVSYEVFA